MIVLGCLWLLPAGLRAQDDPDGGDLEDEVDIEEMMEEDWEFEEFSAEDEFQFEDEEAGERELMLGPVRLQQVAGREGVYVFDVSEKTRTEVVIVDQFMKVLRTVIYPDGKGEISINDLLPGEYYVRFSWESGEVIEKLYRLKRLQ